LYVKEKAMDNSLKLCPFCGSPARSKVLVTVNWRQKTTLFGVECTNCAAAIGTRYLTQEDASVAWNRRINETN